MHRPPVCVLDCVTFVQALISETGPAVRCLDLLEERAYLLVISRETLAEIREVLARSSLRDRYPQLTDERVDHLTQMILAKGKYLRTIRKRYRFPRDPDDEPYLNLAIAAGAEFLVTRDKDLLDLMNWRKKDGREFQKRFRNLRIVDPVSFVKEIEKRMAQQPE